MQPRTIVVAGTLASNPYAGMAWMHMQIAAGLRRLGHDVYYFESTSAWPYDPERQTAVNDSAYALPYLKRVAEYFQLDGRWAYRRSYSDKQWFGLAQNKAEELLARADAVLNVTGATRFAEEGLKVGRLVYLGTDPGVHEIAFAGGDEDTRTIVAEHDDFVTYGENIGTPRSNIPALPRQRATMRQPVLLDLWHNGPRAQRGFSTVGNWKQSGRDISFNGDTYFWSKHHEFLKFIDLPRRVAQPIELATGVENLRRDERALLESNVWRIVDAHPITLAPGPYRDYIRASRGEFTVAKDMNVRLKSGWFSERSACYLAAGRPVITQDTGFGAVLPTGAIAEEYFRAETVLAKLLDDLAL